MYKFIKKRINMNILGGMTGSVISWFGFTLYVYFVPIFSDLFFPVKSQFISIVLTLSVFAVGFIVRPIGGFVFGYLGDIYGRRRVLLFTATLMGVATSLIAFIPTYAVIGIAAPIFLIILRLLQGFAIGGDLIGASSLLIEHAKDSERGFAGSLIMCGSFVGMLLASAVAMFVTMILSVEQLVAWGWRVAFLMSGLLGAVTFAIRFNANESPKFEALKKMMQGFSANPAKSALKQSVGFMFLAVIITSSMAIAAYYFVGYFTTFLIETQGFSLKDANLSNFISIFVLIVQIPLFGLLSDKIGRKPVILASTISFILFAYPIMGLISQKSFTMVLLGQILFGCTLAPVSGVIFTIFAELFPTNVRNTASAIGYNISFAVFGGTAPLVAVALVNFTNNIMAPAWYLMGAALVSTAAILFTKDNYKNELL